MATEPTAMSIWAVSYRYDAWGNLLSTTGDKASTVGLNNPLRYRGYVYDRETKLYYLQSRYYDPEMGRFLNADVFVSTGQGFVGYNMFAYCNNNPVISSDPSGMSLVHLHTALFDNDCSVPSKPKDPIAENTLGEMVEIFWNNLYFDAGIGQGLYCDFEIMEFGGSIGAYGNYASVHYADGQWEFGTEASGGLVISVFLQEVGFETYKLYQGREVVRTETWWLFNSEQETVSLFGGGLYVLFLGGYFDIGINVIGVYRDLGLYK